MKTNFLITLAGVLQRQHQPGAARDAAERSVRLLHKLIAANPQVTDYQKRLSTTLELWLALSIETRDHASTAAHLREYLEAHTAVARTGEVYVKAAHLAVECIPLAQADAALTKSQRAERSERYAQQAIAFVREGLERGLLQPKRLTKSTRLAPLLDHPAFKELLANPPKVGLSSQPKP